MAEPEQMKREALNTFQMIKIIIKEVDGGTLVIQNRKDYDMEGMRQLNNQEFYIPCSRDPLKQIQKEIKNLLYQGISIGYISSHDSFWAM